jgi:hypothetical protein
MEGAPEAMEAALTRRSRRSNQGRHGEMVAQVGENWAVSRLGLGGAEAAFLTWRTQSKEREERGSFPREAVIPRSGHPPAGAGREKNDPTTQSEGYPTDVDALDNGKNGTLYPMKGGPKMRNEVKGSRPCNSTIT